MSSSTLTSVFGRRSRHAQEDYEEDLAAAETRETVGEEEAPTKKVRRQTAGGVYVSWRPPDWAVRNSRRL